MTKNILTNNQTNNKIKYELDVFNADKGWCRVITKNNPSVVSLKAKARCLLAEYPNGTSFRITENNICILIGKIGAGDKMKWHKAANKSRQVFYMGVKKTPKHCCCGAKANPIFYNTTTSEYSIECSDSSCKQKVKSSYSIEVIDLWNTQNKQSLRLNKTSCNDSDSNRPDQITALGLKVDLAEAKAPTYSIEHFNVIELDSIINMKPLSNNQCGMFKNSTIDALMSNIPLNVIGALFTIAIRNKKSGKLEVVRSGDSFVHTLALYFPEIMGIDLNRTEITVFPEHKLSLPVSSLFENSDAKTGILMDFIKRRDELGISSEEIQASNKLLASFVSYTVPILIYEDPELLNQPYVM